VEALVATLIVVALMGLALYALYGKPGRIERDFQSPGRRIGPRYRNDSGTDGDV
jgi:hypothetical protein